MEKQYFIYILTNNPGGTLYIGITNNLSRRIQEHCTGTFDGFTKKHQLRRLVYYESYSTLIEAIQREKQLKHYNRSWKLRLIKTMNPEWKDLAKNDEGA
jgi:putative endonuclease